ncbi:MAG: DUF3006 domain-containing protein [Desulfitobacterium sp.]|nr:DUF3006 domain-containing protein [Desulfitobacterium sp.]
MRGIIDRFEGDYAVVEKENRKFVNIPREALPLEAKEGDVIIQVGTEYRIDQSETEKRRKRIEELSRNLWE